MTTAEGSEHLDGGFSLSLLEEEDFLTFESVGYDPATQQATFQFHYCGGRRFCATMQLTRPDHMRDDVAPAVLQNALLHIGLCILPWYWMGYNCRNIRIEAGFLDAEQVPCCRLSWIELVQFWEEFYQDVLSEFLYLHLLDRDRLKIEVLAEPQDALPAVLEDRQLADKPKILIPLGGGKDSLVVYQLVSSTTVPCALVHVGDRPQEFESSWRFQKLVEMTSHRTAHSPFRFEHNMIDDVWESEVCGTRYKPCGHPWAALVAFDSVLAAILGDFTHIAVGNERSANYGNNVMHEGRVVNHQYDKSFQFEAAVHDYIRKYIVRDVHYFSALQHLWEVQIARTFVERSLTTTSDENFLPVFLSCNEAVNGDQWCCECAKCAFVYILISAWCPRTDLNAIFGQDLFEKESMFPVFESLLAENELKPMECVGTSDETWLSLFLALPEHGATCFLQCKEHVIRAMGPKLMPLLEAYNPEHLIPEFLLQALKMPVAKRSARHQQQEHP